MAGVPQLVGRPSLRRLQVHSRHHPLSQRGRHQWTVLHRDSVHALAPSTAQRARAATWLKNRGSNRSGLACAHPCRLLLRIATLTTHAIPSLAPPLLMLMTRIKTALGTPTRVRMKEPMMGSRTTLAMVIAPVRKGDCWRGSSGWTLTSATCCTRWSAPVELECLLPESVSSCNTQLLMGASL